MGVTQKCELRVSFKKQSFTNVLQNRCSKKFCNIYRKVPGLESFFNKVTGLFYKTLRVAASVVLKKFVNFPGKHEWLSLHWFIFFFMLTGKLTKSINEWSKRFMNKSFINLRNSTKNRNWSVVLQVCSCFFFINWTMATL